jgi:2-dehydro-3-deoxyphosphooctonate aldolase (KDO 8-P synthase)
VFLIAGPCVAESYDLCEQVAGQLKEITDRLGMEFVFKASFDKANRSSISSSRGPGIDHGLAILESIRNKLGVRVLTDVHESYQAQEVAEVADVLQIPALLCRQTDLIQAAAGTGKIVNIKKGQFMAPADMALVAEKAKAASEVWLCERGTSFGYRDLVVDMRSLVTMRGMGKVVFDATHSTAGNRSFAPALARAAVAVGVDGLFIETHPDPDRALSDGPSMVPLGEMDELLRRLVHIDGVRAADAIARMRFHPTE